MLIDAFIQGLQPFLHPEIWLLMLAGVLIGLTFGILPGLSGLVALAILLPFVFLMEPDQALPLFIAITAVGYTGGSITAILLNVPGTSVNAATLLDGFPMTQKGQGDRALGAALTSSGLGGIISVIFALVMVPIILPLIYAIQSADMVFLIVMGISFIAVVSRGSMLRGLIAGGVGLMISLVGLHVVTGVLRFTFGTVYLIDGLPLIPMVLGLFAIPEMVALATSGGTLAKSSAVLTMRGVLEGVKDVFRHWGLWLRSSIIGYLIGVIPGVGAGTAIWVAYGQAKQTSKNPERFGTGIVEGVIAPESCNNAKEGGALLTTLALGIPGSAEMVVFLGAIITLGIRPGPDMLTIHLPLSMNLLQVLFIGSFLGAVVCLFLAPYLARIATIPAPILVPIVTVVVFIGAFAFEERFLGLVVLLAFGALGLVMRKYDFNRPALLLGFVLGSLFEKYLFLAYGTGGALFFLRPISLTIILITVGLYAYGPIWRLLSRKSERDHPSTPPSRARDTFARTEAVTRGVSEESKPYLYSYIAVILFALAIIGLSMPMEYVQSKILPLILGGTLFALSSILLIREFLGKGKPVLAEGEIGEGKRKESWHGYGLIGAWLVVFFAMISFLGFLIAIPVFVLSYMKWQRLRWRTAILSAALITALTYIVFVYFLKVYLFSGLLFL